MRIRLTRKLADYLDGVDLSACKEGDVVELSDHDAELLIAEGWATPGDDPRPAPDEKTLAKEHASVGHDAPSLAAALEHLHRACEDIAHHRLPAHEHRRAEDRIREEIHDERSTTIGNADRTPSE